MISSLRTLPALLIAVLAAGSAFAQSIDGRVHVLPHVLEASARPAAGAQFEHSVKAPRDCASGQASGKRVATYDLKTAKGARTAAPGCADQPSAKHTKTGHVTLLK